MLATRAPGKTMQEQKGTYGIRIWTVTPTEDAYTILCLRRETTDRRPIGNIMVSQTNDMFEHILKEGFPWLSNLIKFHTN